MLNLQFTIQGTDGNDPLLKIQARGVVAALHAIYGADVLPEAGLTITNTVGGVSVSVSGPKKAAAEYIASVSTDEPYEGNTAEYLAVHAEEPDAAAAFGGAA